MPRGNKGKEEIICSISRRKDIARKIKIANSSESCIIFTKVMTEKLKSKRKESFKNEFKKEEDSE